MGGGVGGGGGRDIVSEAQLPTTVGAEKIKVQKTETKDLIQILPSRL